MINNGKVKGKFSLCNIQTTLERKIEIHISQPSQLIEDNVSGMLIFFQVIVLPKLIMDIKMQIAE